MKFIDDLSKVLNILVRNAETNFGRQSLSHHYVPVSTRRMRCKSCQRRWKRELFAKDNLSLERTKSNTSKYMGSQNSDVSSMPRETESNLQTWNFDPIPSESRDWPDESYKDKQYMQRIEEFKYDAQPSQKLHFIAKEFIKKINKKIYHNAKHVTRFFLHVVFNNVTSLPVFKTEIDDGTFSRSFFGVLGRQGICWFAVAVNSVPTTAMWIQRTALFAWIEEADQNPQVKCRDDPQEAQMAYIDLTQWERVHTGHHRKSRD